MAKIMINSVEEKVSQKGKKYFIVMSGQIRYICWSDNIKGMVGTEIDAEVKETVDDMGNTRRTLNLPGTAEGFKKPWGGKTPEQERKISRHVAFKGAIEIGVSRKLDDDEIIRLADFYFEWLERK